MNTSMRVLCPLIVALLGAGCTHQPPKFLNPSVTGYNYTSAAINSFTVNGDGGPNLGPYTGGGGFVCCTTVPRQWQPGMTVTVEWEKDPNVGASVSWPKFGTDGWREEYKKHAAKYTHHRVTVDIPRYEVVGTMKVHFLPCDQVLVAVNNVQPGYPGYPHNDVINALNLEEPATCPNT